MMSPGGTFTTLYEFPEGVSVGGGLVQASDGDFYGTTLDGGETGNSTIFRISPTGTFSEVASFPGNVAPETTLIEGEDGHLYGASESSGAHDAGTIFKVTREGTIATLFEFGSLYEEAVGPYSLNAEPRWKLLRHHRLRGRIGSGERISNQPRRIIRGTLLV